MNIKYDVAPRQLRASTETKNAFEMISVFIHCQKRDIRNERNQGKKSIIFVITRQVFLLMFFIIELSGLCLSLTQKKKIVKPIDKLTKFRIIYYLIILLIK